MNDLKKNNRNSNITYDEYIISFSNNRFERLMPIYDYLWTKYNKNNTEIGYYIYSKINLELIIEDIFKIN